MGSRSQVALATLFVAVQMAVLAPQSSEAANVTNGNFESGTLRGWQISQATQAGNWFAYTGTAAPIGSRRPTPADPVQSPPRGAFAAISDQANPDSLILYQDVALEAEFDHELSLLAYYDSYEPISVPTPNTLSVDEEALGLPNGKVQKNQQFRIDVIKPEAPLDSLDPADVLQTVFATKPGDPLKMTPTRLTADLTAFAGETVRIRIAVAVTEEVLNAGVDAVSVASSLPERSPSRGTRREPILFAFGRLTANRSRGTAILRVRVSGSGLLRAKGVPAPVNASRSEGSLRARALIEPVTIPVAVARTVTIRLRPTAALRAILRRKRKLRVEVGITFIPTGSSPEAASLPVVFKLKSRSRGER